MGGGGCGGGHGPGAGGGNNVEGHGGMMWIIVKGNIDVGGSGSIEAHGGRGQLSSLGAAAATGGGGTGGGAIHVLYGVFATGAWTLGYGYGVCL